MRYADNALKLYGMLNVLTKTKFQISTPNLTEISA